MLRPVIKICSAILITLSVTNVHAEACTYSEAMMALNNGNLVRGQALMKMAARDGDARAVTFVTAFANAMDHTNDVSKALQDTLAKLEATNSKRTLAQKTLAQQNVN
ncbi:MAG: hypothetical protein PVF34_09250 [Gammaproteobacteria bacterium]|jgi:hypothetical protein